MGGGGGGGGFTLWSLSPRLYLQSLVTQFFPTSPNQIYYVTKLEALYVHYLDYNIFITYVLARDHRSSARYHQ